MTCLPRGALGCAAALALAGCGGGSSHSSTATNPTAALAAAGIRLQSPAFADRQAIPRRYTCDGRGTSPPLRWSNVPPGAREVVLLMRDPDAPGGNFNHWAMARIAPNAHGVRAGTIPAGAVQGTNSAGSVGYTPPCPPRGDPPHHYVITVVALRRRSGLRNGFDPRELPTAGLATGTLVGTYARRP